MILARGDRSLSENCCYSFSDLFRAARKREATPQEVERYQKLNQVEKNNLVKQLVSETNGVWVYEDRLWEDGVTYSAFWPNV